MSTFGATGASKASTQKDASAKTKTADEVAAEKAKATETANKQADGTDKPVGGADLAEAKDKPVDKAEEESEAQQKEVPIDQPNKPTEILDESEGEKADRHIASTELGVGDVTKEESQDEEGAFFDSVSTLKVPGAAVGPDTAGVVRNDDGNIAYAPPGTLNAAMNGVQEDASGHVDSIHTDNSSRSGTRI